MSVKSRLTKYLNEIYSRITRYNNYTCYKHNMTNSTESIEGLIIPTTWEEKDTDLVVQYQLYKKLNLKSVDELSQ